MKLNRLLLLSCSCTLSSATKLIQREMKKIILTISISLLSISSFAQKEYKYVPFPTSDAVWSEVYYPAGSEHYPPENHPITYERFAVNGEDTIINGISYKKIYMFYNTDFDKNTASYIGALREDEQKRIWLKTDQSIHPYKPKLFSNAEEILLYDFSVKEGDTIKSEYFNIAGGDVVVEKIDTIKIGNTYRKKIKIKTDQWINLEWIEGIGSLYGLFFASHLATPTGNIPRNVLIEFKHQNEILYSNDARPTPLLTPDKLWSILDSDNSYAGFPDQRVYKLSHWIKTGPDTIVNGKTYLSMLYAIDENHSNWGVSVEKDASLYPYSVTNGLLLREENGKVYRYDKGETRENNEESLLYDFNLQEGESISRYLRPGELSIDHRITSRIDSIRFEDIEGVVRKVFYVSNHASYENPILATLRQPEIWIEGIGSLWGLNRNNLCPFYIGCTSGKKLICFHQNEELLYRSTQYNSTEFYDCYYNEPNYPFQEKMKVFIGNDTTFCSTNVKDGIELASHLKITNAVPPLTYKWGGEEMYPGSVDRHPASNCLNDTTIANPTFKGHSGPTWTKYWLEVTDSNGNIGRDTISVRFSQFTYLLSELWSSVTVGDSVLLSGGGISGGIPPYTSYKWSPEKDLRTPNERQTWCVPSEPFTTYYSVSVTDSIGCVSLQGGFVIVNAHPTGVEKITHSTKVYRKGDRIYFENNNTGAQITIYNINGSKLYEANTRNAYFDLAGLALNKGVYVCSILIDNEFFNYKIIK